ncbi:PspC domain-containing protein [uncultured Bacteroides sp.]|uniref:PspC domain-containing protein n=1 Tax=uncultured Bacteroides sp. TaxID=162156 RepID=UPI00261A7D82|nr:PspC domain-containing protein [uncultured Bacteroides sp.]
MKKTLTVNLGGTVYHIDEDAYTLLDNYLNNLRYHFRKEEGAEEIVKDMEVRIAELFNEFIHTGIQVITIEHVESVIARMGKPEDLNGDESASDEKDGMKKGTATSFTGKRLFRDPDNRILGGVASGLAAYFGWDPTWVRIILLILGFCLKGLILAYIIAWIVIPLAHTATEKLQMRGKPINMESIGKTVTDGFEKVDETVNSGKTQSVLQQLGDGIVKIAGFIIKCILVVLAICMAPALIIALIVIFALLMAATGLIASVPSVLYHVLPNLDWSMIGTSSAVIITMSICGIMAVGIPIIGLFQVIFQSFNIWKPMSTSLKVTLIILWIVAVTAGLVILFNSPFIITPLYQY